MRTLRAIREAIDYDLVMRLERYGHLYVPVALGALRPIAYSEGDGVRITLHPTEGLYRERLYVLPREYWRRVFAGARQILVFFRKRGAAYTAWVPFAERGKR
jgi:hypothetical protein